MKAISTFLSLATGMIILFNGCGKSSDNPVTPTVYHLTVNLDASINGSGQELATTLSQAALYSGNGTNVKTATVADGKAQFELTGLTAGDYFVQINSQSEARIPVRITSVSKDLSESVATTLDNAVVLVGADSTYHVKTFGKITSHPLVKYSDGQNVATETYLYAILSLKESPKRMEINDLSTARMVLLQVETPAEPHVFKFWAVGTANHGKNANAANCSCHGDLIAKAKSYVQITNVNGYCYKCHYGPEGPSQGFVDPTK